MGEETDVNYQPRLPEETVDEPNDSIDEYKYNCMAKELLETDLLTYEDMLQEAMNANSEEVLPNSDKDHAAVAMSVIFESTQNYINLVVNNFSGEVSNNEKYVDSLTKCIERGVRIRVLTLQKPNPLSKGYQVLLDKKSKGSDIKINEASPSSLKVLNAAMSSSLDFGEPHNFILSDKSKYRLEFFPSKFMAILSFNDKNFVSRYKETFESAFNAGTEIAI